MLNLSKIFINTPPDTSLDNEAPEAYGAQMRYLKEVWAEGSYGLERVVRLALCFVQFFYPVLLIRNIFGQWGSRGRKLAVEAYTVFKFLFPLIVMAQGWHVHSWVVGLVAYFLSETLVHVLHLIFLSDIHSAAISYRRSLLLLFIHYLEVAFDFAVFYMAFDVLSQSLSPLTAIYFSFVTVTTVGFGDIVAKNAAGQVLVLGQLMVSTVFIVVFINYFSKAK